jgi:hypothetical protein
VEGDAAEAHGDFDMAMAWIFASGSPVAGQGTEVAVARHQIVGDAEDRLTSLKLTAVALLACARTWSAMVRVPVHCGYRFTAYLAPPARYGKGRGPSRTSVSFGTLKRGPAPNHIVAGSNPRRGDG